MEKTAKSVKFSENKMKDNLHKNDNKRYDK